MTATGWQSISVVIGIYDLMDLYADRKVDNKSMAPTKKEKLIEVFADTQRFYREDETLAAAVAYGRQNTRLYEADDYPELPILGTVESLWAVADNPDGSVSAQGAAYQAMQKILAGTPNDPVLHMRKIRVSKNRTFEAAMKLHREFPDKKIAVLNFASAIRPGGGVKSGSSAQEESLCRCSTLYPTLDRKWLWQKYYDVNRAAGNVLHTDACIYSPGVVICKTDESIPQRMKPDDFVTVDVISCAAPNLQKDPANIHNPEAGKPVHIDPDRLREIHMQRARHIMHVAAANKVDLLVLGAFGCGAFKNDPVIVAQAYRLVIREYQGRFDVVEFAIHCKDIETDNYKAFYQQFKLLID